MIPPAHIVKRSDAPDSRSFPNDGLSRGRLQWISRNRRLARDFERYTSGDLLQTLVINPNFPDGLSVGADQTVLIVCPKYNTRNFSIPFAQYHVDIAS